MNIQYDNFSERDIDIVKWQLSAVEISACSIAERCEYGFPRIIVLSPLVTDGRGDQYNYEALSNLVWLTCPFLNDRIHEFEDRGYIGRISGFIDSQQMLKERMATAHSHFYYLRKKLYRDFFGDLYPERLITLFNSGVGGIRDGSSLKCLHMNFAHYRMNDSNVAGYIMQKLLKNNINCDNRACSNAHQGC